MSWVCPNGCEIEVVIANVLDSTDEILGILVDAQTGRATNRWADGVAGVPKELKELAEEDDSPVCPICFEYCAWEEHKRIHLRRVK